MGTSGGRAMKQIPCIVCGRDKQAANVCKPCRQAINRMIKYGIDNETIYIVMMYGKHRVRP